MSLRLLVCEPYFGGSHRAFIEGWRRHSEHEFRLLTLPASKWKWRMRHAAITFADMLREDASRPVSRLTVRERRQYLQSCDVVFCSDMLNLAELRGLSPALAGKPAIVYFHENQYTYPVRVADERDLHFGFTNLVSALSAEAVWFNSQYHCDDFLSAAETVLRKMPDHAPKSWVEMVRAKSSIQPPGIESPPPSVARQPGALRIVWAARWEHDKGPETFFKAVRKLKDSQRDFRLSVLGESFRNTPDCFASARRQFAQHIDHWGFLESREAYWQALLKADVFVSTAEHEFFGIAAAEAMAAGCHALLPNRLAYPELVQGNCEFLYDAGELFERLAKLCDDPDSIRGNDKKAGRGFMQKFHWPQRAGEMDAAVSGMLEM